MFLIAALAEAKRPAAPPAAPPAPPPPPPAPAVDATTPRFVKTPFPGCGCAAYLPEAATVDPVTTSPDGSQVWVSETGVGSFAYGVVAVKLAAPTATPEEAEELLVAYLDFLKGNFQITDAVGLGRGHTLEESAARGVIDFWQSADGEHWSVRAWATPERLAVFLVHGPVDHPNPSVVEVFGRGFRVEPEAPQPAP